MVSLLAANPLPFHQASTAWARLADDFDNAYEQFMRGVRQVDRGWPSGDAALAAIRRLTAQGHELSNTHNPARQVADALERHAFAVGDLRLSAEQAILAGVRNGFTVDRTTGVVSAPASRFELGEAEVTARAVGRIGTELQDLLARAQRLDDETASAIRSCVPAPGFGFGAQLAWVVDRDMVTRQQGRTPEEVQVWWRGLSPEQQEQVVGDYPELVGWLDGVPAADRDRANRVNLSNQLNALDVRESELNRRIAAAEQAYLEALGQAPHHPGVPGPAADDLATLRAQLDRVRTEQAGLEKVRDKLAGFGDRALLIGIDGQGDGKAIISLGNPDQATHTAVFVPGVNTDLLDVGADMDRVYNLQAKADSLTPASQDVAVVYWLGYDAPTEANAIGYGASYDAAKAFTPFVDGLRATHQPDTVDYHVTAVGHSYGSDVIAESALSGGLAVDDIVTAGSPGMHTDQAANLHIDPRHVWGGLANGDLIGGALGDLPGIHGQEPTDPAFGGNRYEVDTEGHSAYWTEGSQSLANQAAIVVGQYDTVGYYYGSPPG